MKTIALATVAVLGISSVMPVMAEPLLINKPKAENVVSYVVVRPYHRGGYYRYHYYRPYRYYNYGPRYYRPYYHNYYY